MKIGIQCELRLYRRNPTNRMVLISAEESLKKGDTIDLVESQTMFFNPEEKGFLASRFFRNGQEYFFVKSENVENLTVK